MSNFEFVLNPDGVRELLTSPEMEAVCMSYAEMLNSEYGGTGEISVHHGPNRVNVSVEQPADRYDNDLLKAVGKVAEND